MKAEFGRRRPERGKFTDNAVQQQLTELESMRECDPFTIKRQAASRQRAIREDAALYYDENVDKLRVKQYYAEALEGNPDEAGLFTRLHELLRQSHRHHISYHVSKDQYLYPWVDLQPDGRLRCIYSGVRKDPERAIEEDFDTILLRYARFRQLVTNDRLGKSDLLSSIRVIAREHKFNTEHIVPQSWYNEREPMKGDLHHLFVCEPRCNTARANFHYAEFPDDAGDAGPCGMEEPGRFEPNRGKGIAARAQLYFLLRYPRRIKRAYRSKINIPMLIRWHGEHPVSLFERHRNMAIAEVQGNRNPLIDMPELAYRIDFSLSL